MKDKFFVQFDAKISDVDFDSSMLNLKGEHFSFTDLDGCRCGYMRECKVFVPEALEHSFSPHKKYRVTVEEIVEE